MPLHIINTKPLPWSVSQSATCYDQLDPKEEISEKLELKSKALRVSDQLQSVNLLKIPTYWYINLFWYIYFSQLYMKLLVITIVQGFTGTVSENELQQHSSWMHYQHYSRVHSTRACWFLRTETQLKATACHIIHSHGPSDSEAEYKLDSFEWSL